MTKKNGNVQNQEEEPGAQEVPDFKPGDVVRLSAYALKNVSSSPNSLYRIGHPNAFQVEKVGRSEETGEPCVSLKECCHKLLDHSKGEILCRGHQARFFEKVDIKAQIEAARPLKAGDRIAAIITPLGELAGMEYRDDPENPHFQVRLAGIPLDLEGGLAVAAKEILMSNGLFPKPVQKAT